MRSSSLLLLGSTYFTSTGDGGDVGESPVTVPSLKSASSCRSATVVVEPVQRMSLEYRGGPERVRP